MSEEIKEKIKAYYIANDIDEILNYITSLQQKAEEKNKEIDRLNNIINYIWQVFENGSFEDGCDCIKIYDYLKELKEE